MNLYFNKVAVHGIVKSKFFWEFIKPIMKKKSSTKSSGKTFVIEKSSGIKPHNVVVMNGLTSNDPAINIIEA